MNNKKNCLINHKLFNTKWILLFFELFFYVYLINEDERYQLLVFKIINYYNEVLFYNYI
jgi:hypothetical protein